MPGAMGMVFRPFANVGTWRAGLRSGPESLMYRYESNGAGAGLKTIPIAPDMHTTSSLI